MQNVLYAEELLFAKITMDMENRNMKEIKH